MNIKENRNSNINIDRFLFFIRFYCSANEGPDVFRTKNDVIPIRLTVGLQANFAKNLCNAFL
jgi:hypothetical protein